MSSPETLDAVGILLQPLPLSQAPLEGDEVLRAFLQEMAELDRQPPSTPEPTPRKRQAAETPRPAKKQKHKTAALVAMQPLVAVQTAQTPATRWQRRKQEVQTLKEQVEALSNYASFLQTRRVPGQLLDSMINLPPELDQLLQIQNGGWQAAAIKEIRRCQEAQQVNQELKRQLHTCVKVSGMLQMALNAASKLRRDQFAQNSIASRALQVELMMSQQVDAADNARIFDMLEASVNARADEVHAIASKVSQPLQAAGTEQVSICRKNETHAAVEFRTMRVLPFDLDIVSSVCWHAAQLGWKRHGSSRVVRRSGDVVASDWCFPVQLEKGEAMDIRVRCVAKRFQVPEGFVIIAESTTEWPAHLAASGAWSRVTRESGWGLLHSYPVGSAAQAASRPTATVSRFLMQITCEPSGLDSDTSRKLLGSPAVSDIVIPSYRTLIRNRQQCVDNRLMDAAFAAPSISAA